MDKRGAENIWWILITAALAIIVLIVVLAIFSGKLEIFKTIESCKDKGGECKDSCNENEASLSGFCPQEQTCCIQVFNTT